MLGGVDQIIQGKFAIPLYFDYVATFTWALSGAIVGARRGYDIVGVFVIALVSATGAGLIRDSIFLQRTPVFLTKGIYLMLIMSATLLIAVTARIKVLWSKWLSLDKVIELIDTIGVPAFAVVGMQLAMARDLPWPSVIFIGVTNGVGGGLLRDVIARDKPLLLVPGQFSALVVLLACFVFVALVLWLHLEYALAGVITMGLYMLIRLLTIRFNWRTSALIPNHQD